MRRSAQALAWSTWWATPTSPRRTRTCGARWKNGSVSNPANFYEEVSAAPVSEKVGVGLELGALDPVLPGRTL
jgi:hypothetical protein